MSTTRLTNKQAAAYLGVSPMTLWLWRRGTATMSPLPIVASETGRAVSYEVDVLRPWMRKHGLTAARPLRAVLSDPTLAPMPFGPRKRKRKKLLS